MQILFDKNRLHVQVVCGILEDHTSNEKMKEIHDKVEKLKKELEEFKSKVVTPSLTEIDTLIKEENDKHVKVKDEE